MGRPFRDGLGLEPAQIVGHIDGMFLQGIQWYDVKGALVGGCKHHRGRAPVVVSE